MTTTADGVDVGFVGAVTEDLPSLVSPAGIADLKVSSIVAETNAARGRAQGRRRRPGGPAGPRGRRTTNIAEVDRRLRLRQDRQRRQLQRQRDRLRHTHLAYNHTIGGRPAWAGQYGVNLHQSSRRSLGTDAEPATNNSTVAVKSQEVLKLFGPDPDRTQTAHRGPARRRSTPSTRPPRPLSTPPSPRPTSSAPVVLGKVAGPFNRAKLANGTTENRGGESTLGNLVAEVQRWATSTAEAGAAQIAFMNPGGLRADMAGAAGGYPADLTYKQAAVVQPFANTLVNMKLTGAQIKTVLEQQWQRDVNGAVPTRPFLRLGVSDGFFADLRPGEGRGQPRHEHVAQRQGDRAGHGLLRDRQLVPRVGR